MVGVIEQNDPVTGEMKKFELNAKEENKKKGQGEEYSAANAGQPPPEVAQAMAAAQSAS